MVCSLVSINFASPQLGKQYKQSLSNLRILLYPEICLISIFLKKELGIVSPPRFVYDFSRKIFVKLYSINWPDFIAWLHLLLEILVNICIAIVFWPCCDVIDFKIIIRQFFCTTKKSRQKCKYLENENRF